ncbi:MAG: T9SS type A sorting domain-containing protein [Flavobacteriales bacterium]
MKQLLRLAVLFGTMLWIGMIHGQTTYYVDLNSTCSSGCGGSWSSAFPDLQQALSAATTVGDQIWVAQGTYYPTSGSDPSISFILPSGVSIYGGFVGNETSIAERDWENNVTILSGDIDGDDALDSDNSYSVTKITTFTDNVRLDGFTVTMGYSNASGGGFSESAVYNLSDVFYVHNCQFVNNYATQDGGAIRAHRMKFNIDNCHFENNSCGDDGGAIFLWQQDVKSNLYRSTFLNNMASSSGGAITFYNNYDFVVDQCLFKNNSANGVSAFQATANNRIADDGILINSVFDNNSSNNSSCVALDWGGKVVNCTFFDNSTSGTLGSCFKKRTSAFSTSGTAYLRNNIFYGNSSPNGDEIWNNSTIYVQHCLVEGSWSGPSANQLNNINANPNFIGSNFDLASNSPCIDAGKDSYVPAGYSVDFNGDVRIHNVLSGAESVDMGAQEYSCTIAHTVSSSDVSCSGGNDGSASITLTGGSAPFDYIWSNASSTTNTASTSNSISSLIAGTYTVTATDDNNCIAIEEFEIIEPASALNAAVTSTTNVDCFGTSGGAIDITTTGGTTTYAFLWSNAATSEDLTAISGGTYTLTVTDANGCTTTASASITEPSSALNAAVTSTTNVDCFGNSNGAIDITTTGGTTTYSFLWSNAATSEDLTTISAGNYTLTVTDANGCTTTASASITQPSSALNAVVTSTTNVDCFGNSNGAVDITTTGGTTTYSFLWNNSATSEDLTAISGGTYTLTVTDANGCTATASSVVNEPTQIVGTAASTPSTVCEGDPISLSCSFSGGGGSYGYSWTSNNGFVSSIQNPSDNPNVAGTNTYTVTVTDANGCTGTAYVDVTVNALPTPTLQNINVYEGAEAFALLHGSPAGGVYSISGNVPGISLLGGIYYLDPGVSTAGNYTLKYIYTDGNGCTAQVLSDLDIYNTVSCNAQQPSWPKGLESTDIASVSDIVTTNLNESYFIGTFSSDMQIDHVILTNAGAKDIMIGKFGQCGLIWAKSYGATGDDVGNAIAVQESATNEYITIGGHTSNGYDLGVGSNLTSAQKGFVAQIDYTDGDIEWARFLGPTDNAVSSVNDVARMMAGHVAATGYANISPNLLKFGGENHQNTGTSTGNDMFIATYKMDGGGIQENKLMFITGSGNDEGMAIDCWDDNVYAIGNLIGTASAPVGGLSQWNDDLQSVVFTNSSQDIVIAKAIAQYGMVYNYVNGILIGDDETDGGTGIHINPSSPHQVYATGYFKGTVSFNGSYQSSTLNGFNPSQDGFLARFNVPNGNLEFFEQIVGDGSCLASCLDITPSTHMFVGGTSVNGSSTDHFVKRYYLGAYVDEISVGSLASMSINATSRLEPGGGGLDETILIAGGYDGSLVLNNTISSIGNDQDGFIARSYFYTSGSPIFYKHEEQAQTDVSEVPSSILVYPNPTNGALNVVTMHKVEFRLYDSTGRLLKSGVWGEGNHQISLDSYQAGLYHLITTGNSTDRTSIVKH